MYDHHLRNLEDTNIYAQVTYRLLSRALKVHSNLAKQSVGFDLKAKALQLLI